MSKFIVLSFFTSIACTFFAQELPLEEIMKGPAFTGFSPQNIQWSIDNSYIRFDWNPNNEPAFSPYTYSLSKKTTSKQTPEQIVNETPSGSNATVVNSVYYGIEGGNLISFDLKTKTKKILYATENGIYNLKFHSLTSCFSFQSSSNLFVYSLADKSIKQLTKLGKRATNEPVERSQLEQQQRELFPYFVQQDQKTEFLKKQDLSFYSPCTIEKEATESLIALELSSDGKYVVFVLQQQPKDELTVFADYVTANGETRSEQARPKVCDNDPSCRIGVLNLSNDSIVFIALDQLPDIRKMPEYLSEYGKTGVYETNRPVAVPSVVANEKNASFLLDIRTYDNKDRYITLLHPTTGKVTVLDHQHDEAWIGGPGITEWDDSPGVLGWLDENTCYFQSEETGYSHLYRYHIPSSTKKALTAGKWEVQEVLLSKDHLRFYLIGNKIHPGVKNGYQLDVRTNQLTPLFEGNFGIEWTLSPDEKTWALRYSTPTQPWELYTAPNQPGAKMTKITNSSSPAFSKLALKTPSIVQIPTRDGQQAYARMYQPEKPNGKAVFFVHGAGYLQNAHYYWSYYQREMLFHQKLASEGYTVIDLDYRASEGYGRDWRTGIYRNMGGKDLEDYLDAKAWLVKNHQIDSNKVGIYGGSYGGFITLMGCLKTPDAFACGAALRAVTDWAHYNHEYTSNILNYPGTDPKAYQQSSPIYYAEGLKKPLLLLHGVVDDNVQFQDIVRLNQRFIELQKTTFQLAIFPTEAHSFTYTPAWIDEYRRIYELFKTNL